MVVRLTGELDMSNADDIGTAVLEATPNDALGVILDLGDVGYMDSAGIYVVFAMRKRLRNRGQALRLRIPGGSPVDDALRLAGVQSSVDVVSTVAEGIAAVKGETKSSGL